MKYKHSKAARKSTSSIRISDC